MKYKAYQIAPEYQESPLYLDRDFAESEGMEIYGNRHYESRTSQTFDNVRDALYYDNFDAFDISESDEKKLHELAEKYAHAGHNEKIIAAALSIVTGQKWEHKQICGSCQSDWNIIYYRPELWSAAALCAFEIEYFNTGTEWSVQDENGEEMQLIYVYEHGQAKEEIAEALGVNTADIVLYWFDGWTKTEKYKRED